MTEAIARCTRYRRLAVIPLILGVLMTITPRPAASQVIPEFEQFHTWTDVATIYNFSERFRYDGDYGLRGLLTDSNWTLLYLRPSVRYRARQNLTLHGGVALFYNFLTGEDLPELRPHVGVRLVTPLPSDWVLSNFLRLELRAFYLQSQSDWDAGLRFRWQVQVVSPRFRIGSLEEFYGLASAEPFIDGSSGIEGTFGDRFRFNVGLGRQFSSQLRIDLNYLFHVIRVSDEDGNFNADDHVIRLRFFYSVN